MGPIYLKIQFFLNLLFQIDYFRKNIYYQLEKLNMKFADHNSRPEQKFYHYEYLIFSYYNNTILISFITADTFCIAQKIMVLIYSKTIRAILTIKFSVRCVIMRFYQILSTENN